MATWYILRHADKEIGDFYNPRLRHQDQPISQEGRVQSQLLCPFFADKKISAIYVSEYIRTGQTIAPTAQQLGLAPAVDPRLNEVDIGAFDGLTEEEIAQKYPEPWNTLMSRTADIRFPEGETGTEAQQRILDFFAEKFPQHAGDDIILVSHDGLIRLLMCHIVDLPVYQRGNFRMDLCGLVEITYQPQYGRWKLIRYNQVFT